MENEEIEDFIYIVMKDYVVAEYERDRKEEIRRKQKHG